MGYTHASPLWKACPISQWESKQSRKKMVVGFIVIQTHSVWTLGNLALLDWFCISLFSILLLSLNLWISMGVILLLVILTFLINVFVLLLGLLTMSVCRCSYFSQSRKRIHISGIHQIAYQLYVQQLRGLDFEISFHQS